METDPFIVDNRMAIFVVLEFIDIIGLIAVLRAVLRVWSIYRTNVGIIIVRFDFFLTHLYLFVASWSVVVTE